VEVQPVPLLSLHSTPLFFQRTHLGTVQDQVPLETRVALMKIERTELENEIELACEQFFSQVYLHIKQRGYWEYVNFFKIFF